jgi:hypothetical protein
MRIAVVAGVILLSSAAAYAVSPPPKTNVGNPCAADAERFCNDVPFGKGRRLACLARHESQLAPACRPKLKFMQAVYAAAQENIRRAAAAEAKQRAEAARNKATPNNPAPPPPAPR